MGLWVGAIRLLGDVLKSREKITSPSSGVPRGRSPMVPSAQEPSRGAQDTNTRSDYKYGRTEEEMY